MRTILRSDFFWQFLGGFALGAIGLAGVHLADLTDQSADSAPIAAVTR